MSTTYSQMILHHHHHNSGGGAQVVKYRDKANVTQCLQLVKLGSDIEVFSLSILQLFHSFKMFLVNVKGK